MHLDVKYRHEGKSRGRSNEDRSSDTSGGSWISSGHLATHQPDSAHPDHDPGQIVGGLGLPGLARAQSDQTVYAEALANGWQNWSWATVNLSNTQPVQAGNDSISVSATAYQALYLHHDAFDSSLYSNLVFWN